MGEKWVEIKSRPRSKVSSKHLYYGILIVTEKRNTKLLVSFAATESIFCCSGKQQFCLILWPEGNFVHKITQWENTVQCSIINNILRTHSNVIHKAVLFLKPSVLAYDGRAKEDWINATYSKRLGWKCNRTFYRIMAFWYGYKILII